MLGCVLIGVRLRQRGFAMETRTISLDGLPEPVARGLEVVAQMARNLTGTNLKRSERVKLGVRKGTVFGRLTREEIYNDAERTGDA